MMKQLKLDELMINIPVQEPIRKEEIHIDPEREYFAVTPQEFLIYSKSKKCWYCLRTQLVIPGRISDVIDNQGEMWLFVKNKRMTTGKWGHASSLDDILDLYNSGRYLDWLDSVS